MKVKHITLIILFLISSKLAFSQSDLSVLISTDAYNKLTLEWRKPIFEKMRFKIGYTMGSSNNSFHSGVGDVRVVNDTIVQTFRSSNKSRYALKLGLERQIKSSVFYYGVDLFAGYLSRQSSYHKTFTPIEADSMDVFYNTIGQPGTSQTAHSLSIGGLASIGMNLPISERFLFNTSIGMGLDVNHVLRVTNDLEPTNSYAYNPGTIMNFNLSATVGLRYKLIKKVK